MSDKRIQRKLAAILAADVVGYSRLMERDEIGTLNRLKQRRREIVDPRIAAHGGRMVKLMGDGALIEFASAVDAVVCAVEIQKDMAECNAATLEAEHILFRIGVHVGDVIVQDADLYGDGVNVAARIEGLADPGGICISRTVRDQIRDRIPVRIENRGERNVKNIARPVQIYGVALDGQADTYRESEAARPAAATSERPSIAVLAFDNMSRDAEQEYFSDGIAEDIITDLSKLSELHVIARNSSFTYKGKSVSVPDVARELGVGHVLEGSVRSAGNRVRVTAQLIDGTTGGHIWADRFDRDLTDIFEVQDELTQQIVTALKIHLTPGEAARLSQKSQVGLDAYNLFLRAREQTWRHSREAHIEARRLLESALETEPEYAAAEAMMAFTHVIDYVNGWADEPEASLRTGRQRAETAVGLNPDDAYAHFAMCVASLWSRDLDRACAEAEICLTLMPNSPEGCLALAHTQIFDGDAAAAVETLNAYMRLDPHYPDQTLQFVAEAYISLGRYEDAAAALRERLKRDPQSVLAHSLLASTLGNLGQVEEARTLLERVFELDPGFSVERRRKILPFRDPADFERRLEGFRRAGLDVGA